MLAWMLYAATISLLLTAGALCAAHGARLRGAPARFIWAAALILSLLIPAIMSSVSVTLPRLDPASSPAAARTVALRDVVPKLVAPASLLRLVPRPGPAAAALDRAVARIWAVLCLLLAAAAVANAALLAWRKRGWARATLMDTPVLVAPDAGPALAGLLFPDIVVPAWLLQEPAETQRHVIAHERAHLAGGDTYLLAGAAVLLIAMPWNLPLWWQARRLRFAIETDCDARVIAAGASPARYAGMLIGIGERRARRLAPAMAMSMAGPASHLEKRIRLMLEHPPRRTVLTLAPALAAAALVICAAAVTPPDAPSSSDLARFTGHYEMSPSAVLTVTQQDGALFVRLTGQPALRVVPAGPSTFTADTVGATFDFTLPGAGPATSVTLRQGGQVVAMARIGEDKAGSIEEGTATRMKRDAPAAGSREALAHVVDGIIAGAPDYTAMTPKLAEIVRAQLPTLQGGISGLGPVQSITFVRVGGQGQDVYLVTQARGATAWQIVLARGKIAVLWVSPAP